eukprot:4077410-Pleurochrysis_carterae.AAC.3
MTACVHEGVSRQQDKSGLYQAAVAAPLRLGGVSSGAGWCVLPESARAIQAAAEKNDKWKRRSIP